MRYAADPVEGFFAGLTSGVGRIFFSFLAVAWGAAVCFLAFLPWNHWPPPSLWILLWIGMLFTWASLGIFWFFIGLSTFITMVGAMWYFAQDHRPKLSFFVAFCAASFYFSPVCFREYRWIYAAVIFSLCAGCYWFLPPVLAWLRRRRSPPEK